MRALTCTGVEAFDYGDAPDPEVPEGHALVKIAASGICGSDMHAYLGHDERRPTPLILGHEAAGIVVSGPDAGRRVTINPLVTCGSCLACLTGRSNLCAERQILSMPPRQGTFAEYVAVPSRNLVTVPDDFPLEKAALAEPLACGWHGAKRAIEVAGPPVALRCLAIGGGAIGFAAALSLRAMGARDITILEPNQVRADYLRDRCGETVLAPDHLAEGDSFDIIIDGVGYAATRELASARARPGGVIVHIGLGEATGGLDIRRMTLQEITFIGIYTYTAADFRDTAQAMFEGRLGDLNWILTRPLTDGARAFQDIRAGIPAEPKTVLLPEGAGA
ncbi:zinc-dependent alcohol dehydrogenase [Amaricoccus tamworthensis]|uniref:zinc-dependent alcohol dehydrogenase n=1 Tax=Amaricoccus tamworthensis TaxID=57002 RepID=UPI003C7D69C2